MVALIQKKSMKTCHHNVSQMKLQLDVKESSCHKSLKNLFIMTLRRTRKIIQGNLRINIEDAHKLLPVLSLELFYEKRRL